jgi:hypothetical protein
MIAPAAPARSAGPEDHRLLPFGLLLDHAMGWTRRHLRSVVLPLGVPLAVLNALTATVQAGMMASLLDPGGTPEAATAAMGCLVPVLLLATLAATGLVYSAITVAAVDAVAGREASAKRSFLFVVDPGALGTLLLLGLFTGVSYLCCLLPVLYVGPMLALTIPAMVEEDLRGMDAITRSARLTRYNPRGRFLANPLTKAFVLFAVAFLLSLLLSIATSMPFQIAQQWMIFRQAGAGAGAAAAPPPWIFWLQVPASALSALVSSAVWLYASFGLALLFRDTRRRKEGLDLEAAIASLDRERGGEAPVRPAGAPA